MYKIMHIEDDPQLSELIKEKLERYGYKVFLPQHFAHIEEEFLSIKPELVLMDINLQYYDGYFLCPRIKFKNLHYTYYFSSNTSPRMV